MRGTAVLLALLAVAVCGAAGARADGLPVLGVDVGSTGVVTSAGTARYVTVPVGQNTLVERVDTHGGRILRSSIQPGTYTIPAVAYDGSASGLSQDGRTLVLIEPRVSFPRTQTNFAVLTVPSLYSRRLITLHGDFSFDAVSPHGSLIYLIQYVSPTDPTRYLVRAYDLDKNALLAKPVVDPRDAGEKMRGSPVTRATSPDGRWAYTLYDGAGSTPFVHALDTATRTARCIDLDALARTSLYGLTLHVGGQGSALTVNRGRHAVASVDTRTFQVSDPGTGDSGLPWTLVALATLGALTAAGVLSLGLRRRRRAPALAH